MKGLLLAAGCFAFIVLASAAVLRAYSGNREYRVLLGAFAAAVAGYLLAFLATPPSLGFLPAGWVEPAAGMDCANGLLLLTLVFHGFWTFAYATCLGPSVGLMVAAWRRGARGLRLEEALRTCGTSESGSLILRRRLPRLLQGGYLVETAEGYALTAKGRRYAAVFYLARVLIRCDA